MKIQMRNGLPIVTITLGYQNSSITLEDVLLDTGCAISIFDTDIVEKVGLYIDRKAGRAVRMYGVGGQSELCYQQNVNNIAINHVELFNFILQLGMTRVPYGFNAILGSDFCEKAGLTIDFKEHLIRT